MNKNPYETPAADLAITPAADAPPLWNPNAAGLWSILFTPAFGSYLLMKNWQAIGEVEQAKTAKTWFIVSALLLPSSFMTASVGFIYLVAWYFFWQRKQARYVQARWDDSYPRRPWGKPLAVAFTLLAIVMAVFIAFVAAVMGPVR